MGIIWDGELQQLLIPTRLRGGKFNGTINQWNAATKIFHRSRARTSSSIPFLSFEDGVGVWDWDDDDYEDE